MLLCAIKHTVKLLLVLVYLWISSLSAYDEIPHVEHFVKLGDPWNVSCHTPFNIPTSWMFDSTIPGYYNYYLYDNEKLCGLKDKEYNLQPLNSEQGSNLQIKKTDIYHSGLYACIPDKTTLDHRKVYKLTIIESSTIELQNTSENKILLHISISLLRYGLSKVTTKCFYTYGIKEMPEAQFRRENNFLVTRSLNETYSLDEEVPYRCQIVLNNNIETVWNDTFLFFQPKEKKMEYIKKGSSWNMSCTSASHLPMKWMFSGVLSADENVVLYDKWSNKNVTRYNFTFEPKTNEYSMMIEHVDVYHAGTYQCTHQSSNHLIEKIVDLTVIVNHDVSVRSTNDNERKILTEITFAGSNSQQPQLSCLKNNETNILTNFTSCRELENKLNLCILMKTFSSNNFLPDKCQIRFESNLVSSVVATATTDETFSEVDSQSIHLIIIIAIISVLVVAMIFGIFIKRFVYRAETDSCNSFNACDGTNCSNKVCKKSNLRKTQTSNENEKLLLTNDNEKVVATNEIPVRLQTSVEDAIEIKDESLTLEDKQSSIVNSSDDSGEEFQMKTFKKISSSSEESFFLQLFKLYKTLVVKGMKDINDIEALEKSCNHVEDQILNKVKNNFESINDENEESIYKLIVNKKMDISPDILKLTEA